MGSGIRFNIRADETNAKFSVITIRIPTDEGEVKPVDLEDTEAELALMRFNLGGAEQICGAFQHDTLALEIFKIRETIRAVAPGKEALEEAVAEAVLD